MERIKKTAGSDLGIQFNNQIDHLPSKRIRHGKETVMTLLFADDSTALIKNLQQTLLVFTNNSPDNKQIWTLR